MPHKPDAMHMEHTTDPEMAVIFGITSRVGTKSLNKNNFLLDTIQKGYHRQRLQWSLFFTLTSPALSMFTFMFTNAAQLALLNFNCTSCWY